MPQKTSHPLEFEKLNLHVTCADLLQSRGFSPKDADYVGPVGEDGTERRRHIINSLLPARQSSLHDEVRNEQKSQCDEPSHST